MTKRLKFFTSSFIVAINFGSYSMAHATAQNLDPNSEEAKGYAISLFKDTNPGSTEPELSNSNQPFNIFTYMVLGLGLSDSHINPMVHAHPGLLQHTKCKNNFEQFKSLKLVYKVVYKDLIVDRVELPIRDLDDPLNGQFNLSCLGDNLGIDANSFRIRTGNPMDKQQSDFPGLDVVISPTSFIGIRGESLSGPFNYRTELSTVNRMFIGLSSSAYPLDDPSVKETYKILSEMPLKTWHEGPVAAFARYGTSQYIYFGVFSERTCDLYTMCHANLWNSNRGCFARSDEDTYYTDQHESGRRNELSNLLSSFHLEFEEN